MSLNRNIIPTLTPALSQLGGVWLGGSLTSKREQMSEVALTEKETSYLAILVFSHLDRFIDGCVAVVGEWHKVWAARWRGWNLSSNR
jgi:hypothetical protein